MLPSDMEILFVSHKYPPSVGGMEKQSYELINGTALYANVHTLVYTGMENVLTFFFLLNRRILKKLKENPGIQVIHFNDGLIASMALFHRGYDPIKKTVTIHGLDVVFPLPYFQRKILPRFNRFDRIIAVSQATADAVLKRGVRPDKIAIIANGVDHEIANTTSTPPDVIRQQYPLIHHDRYFITLGRPVKRKGFSWLIKHVIPRLKADFQLVMVGPFQEKPTWKEKIIRFLPRKLQQLITLFLGFPTDQQDIRQLLQQYHPQVVHLGKVPFDDLKILLSNAAAFLMPNIPIDGDMEGFGLVCLEASLANTLVIASALEGITTAIQHKKNGILLPPRDERVWEAQLERVLADPMSYKEQCVAFKTYTLCNFSWDKMCRSYVELFQELVTNRKFS